ncbi:L,D-transpeptidase family protein [Priestia koreensis]|uniref:L,D-transpeptidase family protein n=1 Tax=Priestia koreensis TaxID=284581 RepID=UPI00203ED851|nr:L,D-transpeptidase family protein [Priestia koreensis]MCM3003129.1 L,D-transpeptidase family protein [Priestia koreensis]
MKRGVQVYHIVKSGETLYSISLDYRIPYDMLLSANPTVNPDRIVVGQPIYIPGLPPKESIPYSIYVYLKEKRLLLIHDGKLMKTYPIAVGKMLTSTPPGNYVIVNRQPDPGGPFGEMWLSLSKYHYGIHGTNNPSSIGKAVSLGCIRMYNKDVLELSSLVPNGTGVYILPHK